MTQDTNTTLIIKEEDFILEYDPTIGEDFKKFCIVIKQRYAASVTNSSQLAAFVGGVKIEIHVLYVIIR